MTEGETTQNPPAPISAHDQGQARSKDIFPDFSPVIKGDPSRDDPTHRSFMGGSRFATRHSLFMVISLVAICGMAALFYHADQLLSKSLHQIRTASHIASLVAKIESGTVALNSDSRNFIASKDLRYAANYKKRSDTLANDLKLLVEDPAAIEGQKMATTLNDGITQHGSQFSNLVKIQTLLGFDKTIGLIGNANASLASLEQRLGQLATNFKEGEIIRQLGNIKASELQFSQNPTTKKLQQIQIDIGLLNKALVASSLTDNEKKTVSNLLQSHRSDITQLARTRITYAKENARLGEINAYMAPNLAALINYTGNFSLLARQESKATQDFIRKILAGGSGGIIVILIFFGMTLMRSISRPTGQISEIAMELAHGNVSAPIPYLGNFDETGDLSNALTVFRENMLQADRLRKDLEVALKEKADLILAAVPKPAVSEDKLSEEELLEEEVAEEEVALPGRGLIPNSHNLPSVLEQQEEDTLEDDASTSQLPIGKSAITEISHQLTTTSKNASDAAEEAERTELMVNGLGDAAEKIEDIEILMIGISDQMSLLAVQTALLENESGDAENLIHLDEKRGKRKASAKTGSGQSVNDRIETIQGGTKRAIKAVQSIGTTINDVNDVAKIFSTAASKEALNAANNLLRQSEDLRTMLDNLLGKVDTGSAPTSQPKAKE
jgi:methyl-accepting chemotaxis protein